MGSNTVRLWEGESNQVPILSMLRTCHTGEVSVLNASALCSSRSVDVLKHECASKTYERMNNAGNPENFQISCSDYKQI